MELPAVSYGAQLRAGFCDEGEGEVIAMNAGSQHGGVKMESFHVRSISRGGPNHSVPGL